MKSTAGKCLAGLVLLATLAVTVQLAAQQQPEGLISVDSGTANPVPLINQPLVPDAAIPGGPGFTLTVNGTGFVSTSAVKWNGSTRATTFVSQSQLKATILASDIATAHAASVTVVNPAQGGGTSNVVFFPIGLPASLAFGESAFGAGSGPGGTATGDFNGDGKLDLVVANNTSNNLSVLLGNGDGTFRPHVDYPVGNYPGGVAVADLNGDGKLDLAVANETSNDVSILLGNGDGTFQAAVNYSAGTNPNSVAVADFNRDGKLDLVVTNPGSNNVSILLGNGDGTFQPAVNYASGGSALGEIAIGDFNHDGKLDLAIPNQYAGGPVSVFLGNGDGTFQAAVNYNVGSSPHAVAAGDFNADGKLDLAVANNISNDVSILLGNGDGTFRAAVNYSAGAGPNTIEVADFNEDGKLDLVVADAFSNTVSVLLGNGDGTFQPAISYTVGSQANMAVPGDFNGDGRLDLAIADNTAGTVDVLLQNGTVVLSPPNVNFGLQVLGLHSLPQSVTLTNIGTSTLNISGIAIAGADAGDFNETNTCGASLPPRGHCTFTITFTPAQLGPRTAALTITDNAPGSPQSVPLSGFGVTPGPNATLSATSLTFAIQLVGTTSAAQSVTLTNYGTAVLSISSISLGGADPGDFARKHNCGSSLAPTASCMINVTFTPTQPGLRSATLSITDNAYNSPQMVSLSGIGTAVELNPSSLSFGRVPVGNSSTQTTTLTNKGSTKLTIHSITSTGADSDEFHENNNCGSSVAAGASCTITVTFTPSERGGDSANIDISDSDFTSPQQVSLSGTGCVYGYRHKCLAAISRTEVQSTTAKTRSAAAPSATGTERIGTRFIELVDSSRVDPYANNGAKRELLVRFWYPASANENCIPADYASARVWSYFSDLTKLPLPKVATNSCLDAPVANGEHPVVVFTHGYTGTFTDYTFLFEDLASRGYIVAAIDHTYEATAVEFADGRLVKSVVGSHLDNTWRVDEETLSSALSVRLDDLQFVVNELERLNSSHGDPLARKLDLSRLALAGHSLGGLTTWFGVQRDARFKAAILLDPFLPDLPLGSTETPAMLLTMGRDQQNDDECQLWSDMLGPRLSVNLRGAEHVTPSDLVWLAKGAIKTGPKGPEKTIEALRNYLAAFLDTNLRDKPIDPLLRGPASQYPDATVTTQKQSLCGETIDH